MRLTHIEKEERKSKVLDALKIHPPFVDGVEVLCGIEVVFDPVLFSEKDTRGFIGVQYESVLYRLPFAFKRGENPFKLDGVKLPSAASEIMRATYRKFMEARRMDLCPYFRIKGLVFLNPEGSDTYYYNY